MPTSPSSTVIKAFKVLELFRDHPLIGAGDCARLLDIPRASAYRMLISLKEAGVVESTPSGQYRLGLRLFELGYLAPQRRRLFDHSYLPMEKLVTTTRLPAHLGVRDDLELLYLLKVHHSPDRAATRAGQRSPLYSSALGKVLLAHAPDETVDQVVRQGMARLTPYTIRSGDQLLGELAGIRLTGFGHDREEGQLGLVCMARAIRARTGDVVAALSLPAPAERYPSGVDCFKPMLLRAADEIERSLGLRAAQAARAVAAGATDCAPAGP